MEIVTEKERHRQRGRDRWKEQLGQSDRVRKKKKRRRGRQEALYSATSGRKKRPFPSAPESVSQPPPLHTVGPSDHSSMPRRGDTGRDESIVHTLINVHIIPSSEETGERWSQWPFCDMFISKVGNPDGQHANKNTGQANSGEWVELPTLFFALVITNSSPLSDQFLCGSCTSNTHGDMRAPSEARTDTKATQHTRPYASKCIKCKGNQLQIVNQSFARARTHTPSLHCSQRGFNNHSQHLAAGWTEGRYWKAVQ